eukprot:1108969-Pyramimonas_sp.AAC.1
MSAWRWLVYLCGFVSPRMLANATTSKCGGTDAAAVALTAGPVQRALQCESVTWAGAVSWRRRQQ